MLVPRGNGLSGTIISSASELSRSSGTWLSFFSKEETERDLAIRRPRIQKRGDVSGTFLFSMEFLGLS